MFLPDPNFLHFIYLGDISAPQIRANLIAWLEVCLRSGCELHIWTLQTNQEELCKIEPLLRDYSCKVHSCLHELSEITKIIQTPARGGTGAWYLQHLRNQGYEIQAKNIITASRSIQKYMSLLQESVHFGEFTAPREFVTLKECMALWVCYLFGGVVIDAGCFPDDNTANIQLQKLMPSKQNPRFKIVSCQDPDLDLFCAYNTNGSLRIQGKSFPIFNPIFVTQNSPSSDTLTWFFKKIGSEFDVNLKKMRNVQLSIMGMDNWFHSSPRYSSVAYYALLDYLNMFPLIALFALKRGAHTALKKQDDISPKPHEGEWAAFCSHISLNSLLNGYYHAAVAHQHQNFPPSPEVEILPTVKMVKFLRYGLIMDIEPWTIPALSQPRRDNPNLNEWILKGGIIKKIHQVNLVPFQLEYGRRQQVLARREGWRMVLTHDEATEVAIRARTFLEWWESQGPFARFIL